MLLTSREKLRTLLHVVLLLFGHRSNASPMASKELIDRASEEVASSRSFHGLKYQPGPEFHQTCQNLNKKIDDIDQDRTAEKYFEIEKEAKDPVEVEGYDENFWQESANILLREYENDRNAIEEAGKTKVKLYLKAMNEANEKGNWGAAMHLEGPDVGAVAAFSYTAHSKPDKILVRPNRPETPRTPFSTAKEAMAEYGLPEPTLLPGKEESANEQYKAWGELIEAKIKQDGTYHLLVYGDGQAIVDLFKNNPTLTENKHQIFITHVGPFFWDDEGEKGIVWKKGYNSKEEHAEKQIFEMGLQRLVIHSSAAKPKDFFGLVDKKNVEYRLKANHDILMNFSGGAQNMDNFYSENSQNKGAKLLGIAMQLAANTLYEPRRFFLKNTDEAIEKLVKLRKDPNALHKQVETEVLRVAAVAAENEKKRKFDDISAVKYWNESGNDALEKACAKIAEIEYTKKDLWKEDPSFHLQIHAQEILEKMVKDDQKLLREHRHMLNTQLKKGGEFTFSIHGTEFLSVLTAMKYHEGENPIPLPYGIPVAHTPREGKFHLTPNKESNTVVVTAVNLPSAC